MITNKEINRNTDYKNIVMLAVLGLDETVELFKPRIKGRKYWVDDEHCLNVKCADYITTQYCSISKLLKYGNIERILKW